jgi:glycosyltransferase involved in cell wall biosynthesis
MAEEKRGISLLKLGLLIPAHNVENQIEAVIQEARPWVDKILLVDDGSTDHTREKTLSLGVEFVSYHPNRGKGFALRQGIDYYIKNGFEAILTMDGDGQHDPKRIPFFIEEFKKGQAEVIIGSRMEESAKIPRYRYYPNLVGTYCLSWATGHYIPDSQSGFRLYQAKALKGLDLQSEGFALETELLIKLAKRGLRIASIPIPAIYRKGAQASHYRPVRDTYQISIMVLRSIFWKREVPRPKGVFWLPFRHRFGQKHD